jgi:hypothetical protein
MREARVAFCTARHATARREPRPRPHSGHTTPRETGTRRKATNDILAGQTACTQIARRRDTRCRSDDRRGWPTDTRNRHQRAWMLPVVTGQPVAFERQGVPLEVEPGVQHLAFLRRQRRVGPLHRHDCQSCPAAAAMARGRTAGAGKVCSNRCSNHTARQRPLEPPIDRGPAPATLSDHRDTSSHRGGHEASPARMAEADLSRDYGDPGCPDALRFLISF